MITLRHARPDEKRKAYEWLCHSDITASCMGPPDFPGQPVPDWEQFQEDFQDFYFSKEGRDKGSVMVIEHNGDEIGCVCYACYHVKNRKAEIDIWMRSSEYCGKGYGSRSIKMLMEYLRDARGLHQFIIRPSERNTRAIRAYEKAGFRRPPDKNAAVRRFLKEEYLEELGPGDYGPDETAVLILE
ncbi:GNAT family N-acetyltransferase [Breznakiella homolactica]|uniref:GNAT family N-acetyltransferase n=1 Tax=Breznakiella homolactica TaxID=2798577 RepID=A0A7T7XRA0_9SPIR|nr:GNAT family N-acetyltransferase [Breznakiella homolactica]QQO11040.1 GNAT family N-acetyltransferase [Breznakiella homolactica]